MGKISQDLDTFRMPVDLKIETEGNPEDKRVEVVGTSSEFIVEHSASRRQSSSIRTAGAAVQQPRCGWRSRSGAASSSWRSANSPRR